jgi:hypothetical protein
MSFRSDQPDVGDCTANHVAFGLVMKITRSLLLLCVTTLVSPVAAQDNVSPAPPPVMRIKQSMISIERDGKAPLDKLRKGQGFLLRARFQNATVFGLKRLVVTVTGTGVKLISPGKRVFTKTVDGNGGEATWSLKGRLVDTSGSLHIEVHSEATAEDAGPFMDSADFVLGRP